MIIHPCPFCETEESPTAIDAGGPYGWTVGCPACGSSGPVSKSFTEAWESWNRRNAPVRSKCECFWESRGETMKKIWCEFCICPKCEGSGEYPPDSDGDCPACNGSGLAESRGGD